MEDADGARADDEDGLPHLEIGQALSVEGAGEQFGDGGFFEGGTVRQDVDAAAADRLGGDDHVLLEPAVVVVAEGLELVAHAGHAAQAEFANAAVDNRAHGHPLPHGVPSLPLFADGGDLAGQLVAQHAGQLQELVAVVVDLDVRCADGTHPDLHDQSVPRTGRLIRFLEPERFDVGE